MKMYSRYIWFAWLSAAILVSAAACKSSQNPEQAQAQAQDQNPSQDPAAANVAPVANGSPQGGSYDTSAPASSAPPQSASGSYPAQQPGADASGQYPQDQSSGDYDNYDQPVEYATEPPPPLPEYDQPPCPGDDYIWTPGYWDYDSDGYYWVPGAWVYAPYEGALWTPGYWSYDRGRYGWHRGYWGRHIGYYGGVNYGFGYIGFGYQGGYWQGDHFSYNRTVNNVNTTVVHNVYNYRVENRTTNVNRVSYNGPGGVQVRPRPAEMVAVQGTAHASHERAGAARAGGQRRSRQLCQYESWTPAKRGGRETITGGPQHPSSGSGSDESAWPREWQSGPAPGAASASATDE